MLNTGEILEKYLRGRMSMTDLANILGISPQYISSVVKNVKRPSKNFLDKLQMIKISPNLLIFLRYYMIIMINLHQFAIYKEFFWGLKKILLPSYWIYAKTFTRYSDRLIF